MVCVQDGHLVTTCLRTLGSHLKTKKKVGLLSKARTEAVDRMFHLSLKKKYSGMIIKVNIFFTETARKIFCDKMIFIW